MASLEELAAAMMDEKLTSTMIGAEAQKAIEAENPYYQLGIVPKTFAESMSAQVPQTRGDLWSQSIGASLGGLLGAGLQAYGDIYQDKLTDKYRKAVLSQIAGKPPVEGLPRGLSRQASNLAELFRAKRNQEALDLVKEVQKAKMLAGAKIEGEREARQNAVSASGEPIEDPENPFYKERKEQQRYEADQKRKIEDTTYERVRKLPSYSMFSDIKANFDTLKTLAKQDSRQATVGMISSLARIWDPQGTVKEGEYQLNENTQNILDNIIGDWRQVIMGKGKISPEGKRNMIAAAAAKYNEFGKMYSKESERLFSSLIEQGGDPKLVPSVEYTPFYRRDLENIFAKKGDSTSSGTQLDPKSMSQADFIKARAAELRASGKGK